MEPCAFNEENCVLDPPKGADLDMVESISCWKGELDNGCKVLISCWKLTLEELEQVKRTGRVWLTVLGHKQPPLHLSGENPFKEG